MRILVLVVVLLLGARPCVAAGEGQDAAVLGEVRGVYERLELPDGERMGLVGLGLRHAFSDVFSMGIGSWMAVDGDRGGFISLGFDGALRYGVTDRVAVETGLFVGAGGGRGGYTLSGGGLMLRTHGALLYDVGAAGRVGAGVSYVNFPSGGAIESVQPFLVYSLPFESSVRNSWDRAGAYGCERSPHSLAVVVRDIHVPSSAETDSGGRQEDVTLLGVEWRTYFGESWYAKFETEGAAGGNSTGYMQILVGGGVRVPLAERLYLTADAAVGGAGGGNVYTGGGVVVDGSGGLEYFLTSRLFAGVAGGYLAALDGSFEGGSLGLKLGYQSAGRGVAGDEAGWMPTCFRVRGVHQSYVKAADGWRSHHADQEVHNLGVQFDAFLTDEWYLTGQGIAAYDGNAGAYMIGLVGSGVRWPVAGDLFVDAEGLLGAAGGGGLAMGSGLVGQGSIGIGYELSPSLEVLGSVGRLEAFDGEFKANVIGVSVGYLFTSSLL